MQPSHQHGVVSTKFTIASNFGASARGWVAAKLAWSRTLELFKKNLRG
jgi:hypothetical protein